ncbi:unnamed protein product, partial [Meganyctiphanes norvegica]
ETERRLGEASTEIVRASTEIVRRYSLRRSTNQQGNSNEFVRKSPPVLPTEDLVEIESVEGGENNNENPDIDDPLVEGVTNGENHNFYNNLKSRMSWKDVAESDSVKPIPEWTGALPMPDKILEPIEYFRYYFDQVLFH